MSSEKEKNIIPEDEILSSLDPPLRNIFSAEKEKGLSESYKQFITNYAKGYGLFLMRDFIGQFSSNDDENPPISTLFDMFDIDMQGIIDQFINEHKKELNEKMKKINIKEIAQSFIQGPNSILFKSLLGTTYIIKNTFLMEQSLIALVISIETYIRDSIIEYLNYDKSLISKFKREESKLKQAARMRIYNQVTTFSEEIVKQLRLNSPDEISQILQKRLGYSNFLLDEKHKNSIIRTYSLRHSYVHRNGIVDQKLKNAIKCRYKLGNRYKIKDEEIIKYYSHCFDIITELEKWKIKKRKINPKK